MPAPKRIHHINFVVRDLESAIEFYEDVIGLPKFAELDHDIRGSRIARSKVGDTWFVLVCPYDKASIPGRHLERHGEGFFLLSFGVNDLETILARINTANRGELRPGILNWKVADIGEHQGTSLQLTEDPD